MINEALWKLKTVENLSAFLNAQCAITKYIVFSSAYFLLTFGVVGIVILGNAFLGFKNRQKHIHTHTHELGLMIESQVVHCHGWGGSGANARSVF